MSEPSTSSAGIINAIASLIGAAAWPSIALLVMLFLYFNSDKIVKKIDTLMLNKDSAKLVIGPSGVTAEIVANRVTKAVVESVEKSKNASIDGSEISEINKSALATVDALQNASTSIQSRFKILWVDDHPENNISLQYAFQTLGIIIVNIDSNQTIRQAFYTSGGFNVVISDMQRDGIAGRTTSQPLAGLETVQVIHDNHPGVPVIIYAGQYASEHMSDPLQPPVISITNSPQEVFTLVSSLVRKRK